MKIFNKRRIAVLAMVMVSLIFGFSGFYGVVMHVPFDPASGAKVETKNTYYEFCDTAICNDDGEYEQPCPGRRFYDMKAFKGTAYEIKHEHCSGELTGDEVDFMIGYGCPDK